MPGFLHLQPLNVPAYLFYYELHGLTSENISKHRKSSSSKYLCSAGIDRRFLLVFSDLILEMIICLDVQCKYAKELG